MFRLLHLPFVAYKPVMMWADHKSLQVEPMPPASTKIGIVSRHPKSKTLAVHFPRGRFE